MPLLKRALKAVLPRPFLRAAVHARDGVRFLRVPQAAFDLRNLRAAGDVDLPAAFRDAAAAAAWQEDHAAIASLFGAAERHDAVNPGDRRAIYYLVHALKPKRVLEIGTHVGGSALHIARALRSGVPDGRLTTVDILDVNRAAGAPWIEAGLDRPPRDLLAQLGCERIVDFAVAPSLAYMAETKERFDFIFLDGDHSARAVYLETAAACKLLRPGGAILLHDYYPDGRPLYRGGDAIGGPHRALRRACRECPDIAVLPLGALPWPTKDGSNLTSLALVARRAPRGA